jgi:hypothetical protein
VPSLHARTHRRGQAIGVDRCVRAGRLNKHYSFGKGSLPRSRLHFRALFDNRADDFLESLVFNVMNGLHGVKPGAFSQIVLGPFFGRFGDVHEEDGDEVIVSEFLVEIAADGFGIKQAEQPGFFPGFLLGSPIVCRCAT